MQKGLQGIIANGLTVFKSVQDISHCKLVNWLTKKKTKNNELIDSNVELAF